MHTCIIDISTQTASFRDPEFQNFHRSLKLPPPTTIIGLVGAALGLSPCQAQEFFDSYSIRIGVYGVSMGKVRDLWKYNNRVSQMWLYHPNRDGSVILREILMFNRFYIAFACNNLETIKLLEDGFRSPVFSLSMGASDSIAKINRVLSEIEVTYNNKVQYCLLEGDVIEKVIYESKRSNDSSFSIYQTSEPIVHRLPVKFNYEGDYGKREVTQTAVFSFIGSPMSLNYKVEGLVYEGVFIPIVDLSTESLTSIPKQ